MIPQRSPTGSGPEKPDSHLQCELDGPSPLRAKPETVKSTCLLVMGMAGSGKTTFVQKLAEHVYDNDMPGYLVNLDPACHDMPYPANIDIRDTINYKKVMKEYELGPNGAIITSLNLYTTKFDQLARLLQMRGDEHKHIIIDTPGQIEVFNWSASGMIITETLASLMPTAVVYVMDTVRNKNPSTFMSNMIYACSILYKTKLPLIVVLNKTDLQSADFIVEWMNDFEKFEEALENERDYNSNLTRSMSLVLDTFYADLRTVRVSSLTGLGMDDFVDTVVNARQEYIDTYWKDREAMMRATCNFFPDVSQLTINDNTIPEENEVEKSDNDDKA